MVSSSSDLTLHNYPKMSRRACPDLVIRPRNNTLYRYSQLHYEHGVKVPHHDSK
jgi:hypothetical protein